MKRRDWIKLNGFGMASFFLSIHGKKSLLSNKYYPEISSLDFGSDFLWGPIHNSIHLVTNFGNGSMCFIPSRRSVEY